MIEQDYPMVVYALSEEDGGGYMAAAPDLQGCLGDGETVEAALADLRSAILEWIDEAQRLGRPVPEPGSLGTQVMKERHEITSLVEAQDRLIQQQELALAAARQEMKRLREKVSNLLEHDATTIRAYSWGMIQAPLQNSNVIGSERTADTSN